MVRETRGGKGVNGWIWRREDGERQGGDTGRSPGCRKPGVGDGRGGTGPRELVGDTGMLVRVWPGLRVLEWSWPFRVAFDEFVCGEVVVLPAVDESWPLKGLSCGRRMRWRFHLYLVSRELRTSPRVLANLNQWYPASLQSFDLPFHDFNGLFHKLEFIVDVNSF
ncbi:hypothetical protein Tco_1411162 [Tanacetum coccineum]